tara:strand:+ start:974 stop:2077 length:1104 start_codon:yes stop_codon:yes gene_type:complete
MDSNKNIISLAEVQNRGDARMNGTFKALVRSLDDTEQSINYVSPYASNSNGGFVAIPEDGVEILVCSPVGSNAWYYLGATFAPEPGQVEGDKLADGEVYPLSRIDPENYKARGVPMRISLKSVNGAGLTISEEYNPKFINKKTELKSTVNKTVSLNDSPAIDAIVLDSGNGAKITLSDNPQNQSVPSRAIQVETVGPQKYINNSAQTDIVVIDGKELQMLNNSTGTKAPEGQPDLAGNVNIQSKWKDVNVFTQAKEGRIFIECLNESGSNQVIQIETNGAGGAIVIKTKGDIRLDAGGNIDMKAGGQIRMQSAGTYSIDSGGALEVQSASTANIEAPTIQLANGAGPVAPVTDGEQSYYGNTGVTTY